MIKVFQVADVEGTIQQIVHSINRAQVEMDDWGYQTGPDQNLTANGTLDPGKSSAIRLTSDALRNIQGIAGGYDGRVLTLMYVGVNTVSVRHWDVAASAVDRIALSRSAHVTLAVNDTMTLRYDGVHSSPSWRALAVAI